MLIGIEASRANRLQKTGVEWYAYHVIQEMKRLPAAEAHSWLLYTHTPLAQGLEKNPEHWHERQLAWPPKYLWTQARLSFEMLRRPPEVLFVPAHVLPRFAPKRSVVTVHDVGFARFPEAYKRVQVAYHHATTRDIVRQGARIITVSEFCKREIIELYGAHPENILVTPLGLDHERFIPQTTERNTAVMAKHGIQNRYLLFVGRIDKKKNLKTLVKAFEQVADQYSDLELVIAGTFSGPAGLSTTGAGELLKSIEDSPHGSRIKILGYLHEADKPALLSGALAYVQPSIYEGFGLPPLEAMACGTPVLSSTSGSLLEVLGEDNALFFHPEDTDALRDGIEMLVERPEMREELRAKGLAWVKRYTWTKTAEETLKALVSW